MANLYEKMVLPRLEDIRKWAENGVTEEDIAKNCGVSYASFRNYKKNHLELEGALLAGRTVADLKVEGALFKKATGFSYKETRKSKKYDREAEKYIEESQNTTRYVPPDTQAAMFYLTNRKPGEWKNRQDLNAKVTGELNLEDLIE